MPETPLDENSPIRDDEYLYRRFHVSHSIPIKYTAFQPRDTKSRDPDFGGISLYRAEFLDGPEDVLRNVKEDKRSASGVTRIRASELRALGFTITSDPTDIPGHVVIPEINCNDYPSNRDAIDPKLLQIASIASKSENIVITPNP